MSVGTLKRLLTLLNLAALLGLAGTAYGFYSHRSSIDERERPPSFIPDPVGSVRGGTERIDSVSMRLGKFPEKVEVTQAPTAAEPEEKIISVLSRVGEIVGAIVVFPPYDDDGLQPAIIFKRKGSTEPLILRRGEAIESRPHPDPRWADYYEVPVRYQFVGCEPDPEHDGWVFFLFDMQCDGTDIQKARWMGESPKQDFAPATSGEGPRTPSAKGIYVGPSPSTVPSTVKAEEEQPAEEQPTAVQPVEAPPVTPQPVSEDEFYGVVFEEVDGKFEATQEAVDYLRDNYQKILQDARTKTYVDPQTKRARGIQILGIERKSVANKFGILRDDVILAINGRPVTRQAQAVNIVKEELKANKKIIEVKILRDGATMVKQYDTRDPATRRAARDAFRNRR